jgi:hypothetical protein
MTTAYFSGGRLDGEIRQAHGAPERYHNPVGFVDDPPVGAPSTPPVTRVELYRLIRSEGDEAWYEFESITEGSD